MRSYKFRVWDKLKKEFNEEYHYKNEFISIGLGFHSDVCVSKDDLILQQYTGLNDNNGKEIYEGDILDRVGNGSFIKIVVSWDEPNCRFIYKSVCNLHGGGSPLTNNSINISDWTYWVVCGNIFENPELLEF
jgi:uncharacterized phage protein (TIGR01671 family)